MDKTIQQRLAAVQAELQAPKSQKNNFGGYKYRSCEDILEAAKPLLTKNELTLTLEDDLELVGDWHYVKATATVRDANGASLSTTAFAREPENKKGSDSSQITGAASSYARKYALDGLFCIDDAKDIDTDAYHGTQPQSDAEPTNEGDGGKPTNNTTDKSEPQQNAQQPLVCECCGKPVEGITKGNERRTASQIIDYSQRAYGEVLCWSCLRKQKQTEVTNNA